MENFINHNFVTEEVCEIKHETLKESIKELKMTADKNRTSIIELSICFNKKFNKLLIVGIGILIGLIIDIIRGLVVLQNVTK